MKKPLSQMSLEELWQLFPIILREHTTRYKEWYLSEKEAIEKIVGAKNIRRISHMGSSAVRGLIAKPTVDILLEIDYNCDTDTVKNKLQNADWTLMAFKKDDYFEMSFNKGYTPNGFAQKVYHLHVRFPGDWDELYFRDYLLSNKDVAIRYGELKQRLKERYEHNRDAYTEGKTEFVSKWTCKARELFGGRYQP
ncbi:GrpB family protein [Cellulosispirillum alkaliphilum]|uniref:GrpB family protein n=1 Tax=Cellulosispirillum alkaliphilum TaxID=3039283 RepID=UPI003D6DE9CD